MRTLLLDTDACIEIIRGNPAPMDAWPEANFAISTISRFEIKSGLRGHSGSKRERRAVDFLQAVNTLPFDAEASDQATLIRIELEVSGKPIGPYDTLLAGHAVALGMPLLTRNVHEFERAKDLEMVTW